MENKEFTPTIHADKLKSCLKYVCWIDIMGTQNTMSESMSKSANYVLKLHACAINATKDLASVTLYPVMDGIYITCEDKSTISDAIKSIFNSLSKVFTLEKYVTKQFLVRASLAYGEVIDGHDIDENVTTDLDQDYKNKILLGLPIIQAFRSEKLAPPFGVYIHESARKFDDEYRLQGSTFKWWKGDEEGKEMFKKLSNYFKYCEFNHALLGMDTQKILLYEDLCEAYFTKYSDKKK